ncbi:MAG: LysM peptidoglycan-binding domain-containing protein [Phycisphaerae bacterium]|nr:LysM peptidoglycan-binding domain-containing protein [Phycisphaerae bacterium]
MRDETSTRIGLPVVLVFAIVFGFILTRHSTQPYDVSPPTASEDAAAPQRWVPPTSTASLGEVTSRDWREKAPTPRRWPQTVEAPGEARATAGAVNEPLNEIRGTNPARQAPSREARSDEGAPRTHRADEPSSRESSRDKRSPEAGGGSDRTSSKPVSPRGADKKGPGRESVSPAPSPKPPEPDKKKDGSKPDTGPEHLILPGQRPDAGLRTARATPPSNTPSVPVEFATVETIPATYVVKPRDNLSTICKTVYGTASRSVIQRVYDANRKRLKSRNILYVGQQLRLPPLTADGGVKAGSSSSDRGAASGQSADARTIRLPAASGSKAGSDEGQGRVSTSGSDRRVSGGESSQRYRWHRVRRNESLSVIAKERLGNGRRWREIWQLNRSSVRKPNQLRVGMLIKVPLAVPA